VNTLDRPNSNKLRFSILRHDLDDGSFHFDWMFESHSGSALRTWSVPEGVDPCREFRGLCRRLADHRPIYLAYQGPLSGQRGTVKRIDQGEFCLRANSEENWQALLDGERMRGSVEFTAQGNDWLMVYRPTCQHDPASAPDDHCDR
jgi:hypothetical protein